LRSSGNIALLLAAVLACAAVATLAIGMIVMASGMDGYMDGHMGGMMGRGGGGGAQTPVAAQGPRVAVEIRDFDFFPRDLTVRAGAEVTWTNRDGAPHTATSGDDWDTGVLAKDDSATIRFDTPGAFDYICKLHPSMKGAVRVEAGSPTP